MNRQLISISILLTLGPIFVQDSEILQLSENVAVVKGRAVEFRCQSSVGSKADSWSFAPVGFRTPVTFYHRIHGRLNNLTSFYNSTKSDEYLIIRTESVRMEDAGLFVCNIQQTQGTNTTIETKSAQLIVLESDPICNSSERLFTCSVNYRGNWAPVMEWRRGNADGALITDGLQSSSTNQSVTSILTIDSKATSVSGVKIICRIFFSFGDNATKATADNVPNYTYIWNESDNERNRHTINVALLQGNPFEMICEESQDSTVYNWTFESVGSSSAKAIYTQGQSIDSADFQTKQIYKSSVLSKDSAGLEDAGTYICTRTKQHRNAKQESAQLIVLESNPECNEESINRNINGRMEPMTHLSCAVKFRGNWFPSMQWRFSDEDGYIISQGVTNNTVPNVKVTSNLTLMLKSTSANSKYVCITHFGEKPTDVRTSATNIPEYKFIWTSSVINSKNDVPLVTLVVSIASVIITVLVLLIVYHIFFKKFVMGRRFVANDGSSPPVMATALESVQQSEYFVTRERQSTQANENNTLPSIAEEIASVDSSAYIDLVVTDAMVQQPHQVYRKLYIVPENSSSDDIYEDLQAHSYANLPLNR